MFEQHKTPKWYEADLEDEESSLKTVLRGAIACVIIGGITLLLSLLALTGILHMPAIDASGIFDALTFFALALWMRSGSRAAAIAALALFLIERIIMLVNGAGLGGIVITILIIVLLVNAVRGAFALHRFRVARGAPLPSRWPYLVGGSFVCAAVLVGGGAAAGILAPLLPGQLVVRPLLQITKIRDVNMVAAIVLALATLFWGAAFFAAAIIIREVRKPTRATFPAA